MLVGAQLSNLMSPKLSQKGFWTYHEDGLVKITKTITHKLSSVCEFLQSSLYFGLSCFTSASLLSVSRYKGQQLSFWPQ